MLSKRQTLQKFHDENKHWKNGDQYYPNREDCECVVTSQSVSLEEARQKLKDALVIEGKYFEENDLNESILISDLLPLSQDRHDVLRHLYATGSAQTHDTKARTLGDLVDEVWSVHVGVSITECLDCWVPG